MLIFDFSMFLVVHFCFPLLFISPDKYADFLLSLLCFQAIDPGEVAEPRPSKTVIKGKVNDLRKARGTEKGGKKMGVSPV